MSTTQISSFWVGVKQSKERERDWRKTETSIWLKEWEVVINNYHLWFIYTETGANGFPPKITN